MSSFVQVVISQNELKLLCSVEKWITLKGKSEAIIDLNALNGSRDIAF